MEEFINFFKIKKNIINVLSLAILVLAVPLGINLVRQQQILRSKAAVESIVFTGPNVKEINGKKVATSSSIIVQVTAPDDTGSSSSSNSSSSNSSNNSSNNAGNTGGSGSTGSNIPIGGTASTWQSSDMKFQSKVPKDVNQIIAGAGGKSDWSSLYNYADQVVGHMGAWLTPQQANEFMNRRTDIKNWWQEGSGKNSSGISPFFEPPDAVHAWLPGALNPKTPDRDGLQLLVDIAHKEDGQGISNPDQILAMFPDVKKSIINMLAGPEGSDGWPATCFLREWMKIGPNDPNAKLAQKIMQQMPGQVGFDDAAIAKGCDFDSHKIKKTEVTPLSNLMSFIPNGLVGTVYAGHAEANPGCADTSPPSCPTGKYCDGNVLFEDLANGDHRGVRSCSENGGTCVGSYPNARCEDPQGCSGRPSGVPASNWKQKDASVWYNCTTYGTPGSCVGVPYQCRNGQWALYDPPGTVGEATSVCNGFCSAPQPKYKCVNRTCQVSTDGTGTTDSTCGGTACTGGDTSPKYKCVNRTCQVSTDGTGTTDSTCGGTACTGGGTTPAITQFKLVQDVSDFDSTNFTSYVRGSVSVPVTFKNLSPGTKTIYVRFYDASGNKVAEKSANIELLGVDPVMASCSLDSSGTSVTFEIKGTGFGTDKGTVKHKSNNLNIDDWQDNMVKAFINNPPTGSSFLLEIAKPNGQKVQGYCSAISQLSLGAKTFCRAPSKHDQSNVDISVIEATSTAVLRKEKVKITKEGLVEGLTIKLEANKKYKIGIKAPKTLRRVVEATAAGGTLSIPDFILPVGDIFPVENGDGKINSLDKAELNRQWVAGIDVAGRSGDFNQDSRVNSIDWACMRFDFNKDEDAEPKN